jgi:hypothetical protein
MAMNSVIVDMIRPMLSDVVTGKIHIQQWESLLASNSPQFQFRTMYMNDFPVMVAHEPKYV